MLCLFILHENPSPSALEPVFFFPNQSLQSQSTSFTYHIKLTLSSFILLEVLLLFACVETLKHGCFLIACYFLPYPSLSLSLQCKQLNPTPIFSLSKPSAYLQPSHEGEEVPLGCKCLWQVNPALVFSMLVLGTTAPQTELMLQLSFLPFISSFLNCSRDRLLAVKGIILWVLLCNWVRLDGFVLGFLRLIYFMGCLV